MLCQKKRIPICTMPTAPRKLENPLSLFWMSSDSLTECTKLMKTAPMLTFSALYDQLSPLLEKHSEAITLAHH